MNFEKNNLDKKLNELLQRIQNNDQSWWNWINLSRWFYENNAFVQSIECAELFKKTIGKNFDIMLSLKNKKDFSRFLISIAYEFNNQEVKKFTNHYNFEKFSNSRKTFKKLIYESSKIYTNFYDEQIKFEKKQRNGFTTKEHPKIFVIWGTPQNPKKIILKKGGNKLTRDTYEIIDGHPIYYQILKILIKEFDVTYEELSKDIENKLL